MCTTTTSAPVLATRPLLADGLGFKVEEHRPGPGLGVRPSVAKDDFALTHSFNGITTPIEMSPADEAETQTRGGKFDKALSDYHNEKHHITGTKTTAWKYNFSYRQEKLGVIVYRVEGDPKLHFLDLDKVDKSNPRINKAIKDLKAEIAGMEALNKRIGLNTSRLFWDKDGFSVRNGPLIIPLPTNRFKKTTFFEKVWRRDPNKDFDLAERHLGALLPKAQKVKKRVKRLKDKTAREIETLKAQRTLNKQQEERLEKLTQFQSKLENRDDYALAQAVHYHGTRLIGIRFDNLQNFSVFKGLVVQVCDDIQRNRTIENGRGWFGKSDKVDEKKDKEYAVFIACLAIALACKREEDLPMARHIITEIYRDNGVDIPVGGIEFQLIHSFADAVIADPAGNPTLSPYALNQFASAFDVPHAEGLDLARSLLFDP